jgi:hypothetical protein
MLTVPGRSMRVKVVTGLWPAHRSGALATKFSAQFRCSTSTVTKGSYSRFDLPGPSASQAVLKMAADQKRQVSQLDPADLAQAIDAAKPSGAAPAGAQR